ncbi:30S ribosomal protein S17e [Sulfolobus acidocaldarius]|uniref:Small ribosomal subunit protein eS17 n=5 Tax=Sulfolobus acidocaldarius TaxID=2285 RepID=RS17E_SULAC|nr:30S ribosomal protein S17e [Sulfolobus acidocaldarius]Q4JAX5.1 RecName: Full=Small ribosomal subunit protein eS17; AltName: Full=30S ribosomal protein S17e [Sulfolobus acidocaldarius DSM 639]AAY80054.1 30S ribosomal protein S17E [Sulfolobus acidocaldarius DSM 639]AGE70625.1 30S ribosomal protein S17e [Sulfolobus acidocaldarius N8]AGE72898.1 30S ribosomal protein S17e [Sulfolobus acidocaldarius Ron12/I]ALU29023.1 30S ribosomal protein S17e [Sulfolobus acidocaldarius]ALU31750.1 30S ribosomal
MGNVYTKDIKRVARELYDKFKDQASDKYDDNKKLVDEYVNVSSKKVKNRIAGYLTRYVKISKNKVEAQEASEELEEDLESET